MDIGELPVFENKRSVYVEVDQYPWIAVPRQSAVWMLLLSVGGAETGMKQEMSFPPLFALSIGPTFNCLWGRSTRLPLLESVA